MLLRVVCLFISFVTFTAMNIAWWEYNAVAFGWVLCGVTLFVTFVPNIVERVRKSKFSEDKYEDYRGRNDSRLL